MGKIRVLLADHHGIYRGAVRALLSMEGDIDVVGEASGGREAIGRVGRLQPDVVLMDIAMPLKDGLEAIHHLREENPKTSVLILSRYSGREHVLSSIRAGAAGYIPKRAMPSELVSAIRAVYRGDAYVHPSVARSLVEECLRWADRDPYESLTGRQKEVLKLVAEGRTSREIAGLLALNVKTVLGHRMRVMRRLGLHNRTELVKYAIRKGLTGIPA